MVNGNGNIFDEILRQRKCKQTFATSIDGCTENIPSYLASNYRNLYNSVDDKCNLSIMEECITRKISIEPQNDVSLTTRCHVT